jgi:hypothetical protein
MIEVLKQALEAFEAIPEEIEGWIPDKCTDAVIAIKQAIAHFESQEPVAWADMGTRDVDNDAGLSWTTGHFHTTPLYAHPPQRTWQGLTDEEIDKAWRSVDYTVPWEQHRIDIAKAIEAKLKERNI